MIFEGDEFDFEFRVEICDTTCRYLYREVLPKAYCEAIDKAAALAHEGRHGEAEAERRKANYGGLRWR